MSDLVYKTTSFAAFLLVFLLVLFSHFYALRAYR